MYVNCVTDSTQFDHHYCKCCLLLSIDTCHTIQGMTKIIDKSCYVPKSLRLTNLSGIFFAILGRGPRAFQSGKPLKWEIF